ncbi:hypothetical protein JVU11DRAFT_10541 [Chiua virens]|nr:hypothetical protein JVU11DRAFT_10541 [Chiua virens]
MIPKDINAKKAAEPPQAHPKPCLVRKSITVDDDHLFCSSGTTDDAANVAVTAALHKSIKGLMEACSLPNIHKFSDASPSNVPLAAAFWVSPSPVPSVTPSDDPQPVVPSYPVPPPPHHPVTPPSLALSQVSLSPIPSAMPSDVPQLVVPAPPAPSLPEVYLITPPPPPPLPPHNIPTTLLAPPEGPN